MKKLITSIFRQMNRTYLCNQKPQREALSVIGKDKTSEMNTLADEIELHMMLQSPLLFMLACEMQEDLDDWCG